MAPTKPLSTTNNSTRSTKRSPSSSSAASSSRVTKAGRRKNQWTADLKRKAVRLYFLTTLSQDEIVHVLGHGYCKSDNERRIRELFLTDEVPSRSKWCKHNAAGHKDAIAQWNTFRRHKIHPFRRSGESTRHKHPTTSTTAEAGGSATSAVLAQPEGQLVSQKNLDDEVVTRVNQLGNKYLPAHLRSVASVYRHSLSSTVRSSWISLTSTFRSSETSSIYRRGSAGEGTSSIPFSEKSSTKLLPTLTPEEQSMWDILIDKNQFEDDHDAYYDHDGANIEKDPAVARRRSLWSAADSRKIKPPATSSKSFLQPMFQSCEGEHYWSDANTRDMNGDRGCLLCGISAFQQMALVGRVIGERITKHDCNQRDFYDNTLLFHYVNSICFTVKGIKKFVVNGADIMVQNSCGATFMHCCNWDWLLRAQPRSIHNASEKIAELIDLLEFLAGRGFSFSHRDEHGQTVAHLLFEHMHLTLSKPHNILQLGRILTAMSVDIDALDNQGRCVGQYLDRNTGFFRNVKTEKRENKALIAKALQASTPNSGNLMLDFKNLCLSTPDRYQNWPAVVEALGYSQVIDAKGDSPLIAMLKVWDASHNHTYRHDSIERLLRLGTGINLKDRRGNTALVIAARRGFRSTIEQLLRSGANPNAVNYSGRSILSMTKGWLMISKRLNDEQWYARIVSCVPVLLQSQAVSQPNIHQQRLSAMTTVKMAG